MSASNPHQSGKLSPQLRMDPLWKQKEFGSYCHTKGTSATIQTRDNWKAIKLAIFIYQHHLLASNRILRFSWSWKKNELTSGIRKTSGNWEPQLKPINRHKAIHVNLGHIRLCLPGGNNVVFKRGLGC